FGYTENEFVGQPISLIFTAEDRSRAEHDQELNTAKETGRSEDERWHVRKDGSRFWGFGIVVPLHAPDGAFLGFVKIVRDRTDMKELHETLRHRAAALVDADERKNIFLATLAHELRNPLAVIVNSLHILRLMPRDDPSFNNVLRTIERQA